MVVEEAKKPDLGLLTGHLRGSKVQFEISSVSMTTLSKNFCPSLYWPLAFSPFDLRTWRVSRAALGRKSMWLEKWQGRNTDVLQSEPMKIVGTPRAYRPLQKHPPRFCYP